jgi:transcriptional regulator with XRE-family HTH domain
LGAAQNRLRITRDCADDGGMLTPTRCQAARARLQWTREHLAREAGVDVARVIAFELDQQPADIATIAALTGALEAAGAALTGANDDEVTVSQRRELG